ncbi:MAG: YeeE/YedE thiosulfate transporter family protein [Bdellovibrionales bacterium]
MTPITTSQILLALCIGFAFGWLLHRGKVTNYNVIIDQFLLRDFTVLKVMLSAIVVGGIGVFVLVNLGEAKYAVKDANLLGVMLGAALFGIGMVIYGYCPGTSLAAMATGSIHAAVGVFGMIGGAILYALTFDWVKPNVLSVWSYGKVRLPELTGIPDFLCFLALALGVVALFYFIERRDARKKLR